MTADERSSDEDAPAEDDGDVVWVGQTDAEKVVGIVGKMSESGGTFLSAITGNPAFAALGVTVGAYLSIQATHGRDDKYRRLNRLEQRVREKVQELGESKLDEDFLGSEEHKDLLRELVQATAQSRSEDKIEWFASILVGAASGGDESTYDTEEYVRLLSELTERQTRLMARIWETQRDYSRQELNQSPPPRTVVLRWTESSLGGWLDPDIRDDLSIILVRLEGLGLVQRQLVNLPKFPVGVPIQTKDFRRMMKFIEDADLAKPSESKVSAPEREGSQKMDSLNRRVLFAVLDSIDDDTGFGPNRLSTPASVDDVADRLSDEIGGHKLAEVLGVLEDDELIRVSRSMTGDGPLDSISTINLTAKGVSEHAAHTLEDWPFIRMDIARAIQEDFTEVSTISQLLDLPGPLVHAVLQEFDQRGLVNLAESNTRIGIAHADPGIGALARRGEIPDDAKESN
jgi:hypothetical protein